MPFADQLEHRNFRDVIEKLVTKQVYRETKERNRRKLEKDRQRKQLLLNWKNLGTTSLRFFAVFLPLNCQFLELLQFIA